MHTEAIVIRKRPVREHDQLVVLYSRELGKLSVLARGSLRRSSKQAHAIDEASLIRCELIEGRTAPIMTGAHALRSFSSAKRSPLVWAATQFFLQAVDTLVFDAQPDGILWESLDRTMAALDETDDRGVLRVFRDGQRLLLDALGYGKVSNGPDDRWTRGRLDEQFEIIAQRRLSALDLLYDVAAMPRSW